MTEQVEATNWGATRKHYAGEITRGYGSPWISYTPLCGGSPVFVPGDPKAPRAVHDTDLSTLPLCKKCEKKAGAQ